MKKKLKSKKAAKALAGFLCLPDAADRSRAGFCKEYFQNVPCQRRGCKRQAQGF